jgi:signal transduction histidine kinase
MLRRHADVLLALALAGAAEAQIWALDNSFSDRAALAVLAAVGLASLVWRRRAPTAVLGAMLAAYAASAAVLPLSGDDPVANFAGVLIAIYSVGAYAERRSAVAGGLLAVAITLAIVAADPEGADAGSYVFFGIVFGAPWAFGRAMRRRRRHERVLEQRAVEAVADERARIARELHDIVAHAISVIVVQARGGRRALADAPDEARASFDAIEMTSQSALVEMRRLLGMLRATDEEIARSPRPSLAHIDVLIDQVRATGLPVELSVEGAPRELPAGVDVSAYRIVQEALTNAIKHAGPARARVGIRYEADELAIEIVDDGPGSGDGSGTGHGVIGMRERVNVFGGDFAAGPRAEGGYALRARLPLTSAR